MKEINRVLEKDKLYNQYLDYFIKGDPTTSFKLIEGEGKTMFSAPHSVDQLRNNRIKEAEHKTGIIVRMLNNEINCPIIYKTYNYNDDANYDIVSEYKEKLKQYINENKIEYLFDIHQLLRERPYDIVLGTNDYKNVLNDKKLVKHVFDSFKNIGLENVYIDKVYCASYEGTISNNISNSCKIKCIQVEINSRLLSNSPTFYNILNVFENIARELNKL